MMYLLGNVYQSTWWAILGGIYFLIIPLAAVAYRIVYGVGKIAHRRVGEGHSNPNYVLDDFACVTGDQVGFIHDEMFGLDGQHAYLKHGIQLPTRVTTDRPALVVDVGANVGLFGISMHKRCCEDEEARGGESATTPASTVRRRKDGSSGKLHNNMSPVHVVAFEPIPETYECCRHNFERTFSSFDGPVSKVYNVGIGSKAERVSFHYDVTFSGGATMARDDLFVPLMTNALGATSAVLMDIGAYNCKRLNPSWLSVQWVLFAVVFQAWGKLLRVPLLGYIVLLVTLPFLIGMLIWRVCVAPGGKNVTCDILTLPRALEKASADTQKCIAFLKIDVEGAEEQVCLGIDDATWNRVLQVVIEVHDTKDGRVARLVALLRSKGFSNVTVDEEPLEIHKIMHIKSIFATR